MLVNRAVYDPYGMQRVGTAGDLIVTNETVPATNTGTAVTLTGALIGQGIYLSSAASAPTLTFDSAANIVSALAPYFAYNQNASLPAGTVVSQGLPSGVSFRYKVIISTANAVTLAATSNTGVTVNRGSVPASSSRDFLITVNNGTPAQTYAAATTNSSAVVSGLTSAQCSTLSPGMVVTNSVAGLQGTTILSVNIAAGTVTMSGNASSTNTAVAISFSPVLTVDGL